MPQIEQNKNKWLLKVSCIQNTLSSRTRAKVSCIQKSRIHNIVKENWERKIAYTI